MPTFDASSASVHVFSFKDGLLAKLAHDLEMKVGRFSIDIADDQSGVTATFDPKSLEILHSMKDGRPDSGTLSAGDKKKIGKNITDDVLRPKKHPEIRFASTNVSGEGASRTVEGDLTLHGRTNRIRATVREQGSEWVTSVDLDQRDYGIKPYKALGGALKVQPRVRVEVRIPKG